MTESRFAGLAELILIGLVAGVLSGVFGVGGGIVLVPLLVWRGFDRHRAHATSLASIIPIGVAGAFAFAVAGELDVAVGVTIGLGGVVGSMIGASVMHRSSPRTLTIVFACVLLAAGIRMVLGADVAGGSIDLAEPARVAVALGIGVFAGFFAGLSGVGGGVIIVPAAVFLLGLGQHAAQGTSLLAIVFTAISGSVVNFRNKRVRLKDGLVIGLGGVVGSLVGAQIALGTDETLLTLGFGLLVLFVAAQALYRAIRTD